MKELRSPCVLRSSKGAVFLLSLLWLLKEKSIINHLTALKFAFFPMDFNTWMNALAADGLYICLFKREFGLMRLQQFCLDFGADLVKRIFQREQLIK